jgi:hypothetical protein
MGQETQAMKIKADRVQKIERNMKFVVALEDVLRGLDDLASSNAFDDSAAVGIRLSVAMIRKVIEAHVE